MTKPDSDAAWKKPTSVTTDMVTPKQPRVVQTPEPISSEVVLATANEIIHGERAESYGPAETSFESIADFWTTYLGDRLKPGEAVDAYDVAMLMTLMKVARARTDVKLDTFVDIAGYAALAPRCATHAGRMTT